MIALSSSQEKSPRGAGRHRDHRKIIAGLADAARACSGYPIAVVSAFGQLEAISSHGLPVGSTERGMLAAFCRRVVERASPWIVADLWNDAEARNLACNQRAGIRAASAWPLSIDGVVVGALAVADVIPRLAQPVAFDALVGIASTVEIAIAQQFRWSSGDDTKACYDAVFDEVPDGLMIIKPDGRVGRANKAAQDVLGLSADHDENWVLQYDPQRGVWVEMSDGSASKVGAAALSTLMGEPQRVPGWHFDGGARVFEMKVSKLEPLGDDLLVVVRDVSQLDEARQLLELHSLIVEKTESAVLILDRSLGIEWCNAGFEHLSGFSLDDLAGTSVERFFGDDQAQAANFARQALAGEPFGDQFTWRANKGEAFTIALEAHPIFDGSGNLSRLVALGFDVTDSARRERRKNDFVSMVSHELRAPLTVIRGTLDALEAGMLGTISEHGHDILDLGQRNCERLAGLIEDLLDINQIESGVVRMTIGEVNAAMLMRDALNSMSSIASEADVQLIAGPMSDDAKVRGDPRRITQVLVNLLGNAIKFSPSGKSVEISSQVYDETLRIRVADQGCGIPNAFKPKLFELFSRDPEVAASGKEGFGLGLCISKGLVESMGGQIGYDSEEGIGSTFYFDLPLVGTAPVTAPKTVDSKDFTA